MGKASSGRSSFRMTVLREEDAVAAREEFRDHVIDGLSQTPKQVSSMYFYDDQGSGTLRCQLLFIFSVLQPHERHRPDI